MNKRSIYIEEETLAQFASMDKIWSDITLLPWKQLGREDIVFETDLYFSLSDMQDALQNCIDTKIAALNFFLDWWEPFLTVFSGALHLDELIGGKPSNLRNFKLNELPEFENDMLLWILQKIYLIYDDFTVADLQAPAAEVIKADELIEQIEYFFEEEGYPPYARTYIDALKLDYVIAHDNNLILEDAPEETKDLFRQFTDELADNGNLEAIRIKGYACYGGNSVYECDWETAAECMDILWRDGGFGYAANTLGYIYYYGRLNNGIPDYEKAFFYYSIGQTFGIYESTYKIADMFFYGKYVKPNIPLAKSIIERLYGETRYRFEQGEFDGVFADVALRMGKILLAENKAMRTEIFTQDLNTFAAYRCFLQAEFALKLRMQDGGVYGDRKVMEDIKKHLSLTDNVHKHAKASVTLEYPLPIYELINNHGYSIYRARTKKLAHDNLKITISRMSKSTGDNDEPCTLITYPEFMCCDLTSEVTITAKHAQYDFYVEDEGEFFFDSISTETMGRNSSIDVHVLSLNGTVIAKFTADSFSFKNPHHTPKKRK